MVSAEEIVRRKEKAAEFAAPEKPTGALFRMLLVRKGGLNVFRRPT
ncbi:hypothetical protein [Siphonobacter aquaeclarae]|jgi:hypothetical protein|nr:hypothetical protein [Siphonobacter aquaeclarae]